MISQITFLFTQKEREHREELEQKVYSLQSENEKLKSEQKVAGDQLQKFYKKFFDSVNSIPSHLLHKGLSTTSLNKSTFSMRTSISSIRTSVSSITSQWNKIIGSFLLNWYAMEWLHRSGLAICIRRILLECVKVSQWSAKMDMIIFMYSIASWHCLTRIICVCI